MKVFVTGATGFIGSKVVDELIKNGHHVTGLSRTPESASKLIAAGATPHLGDLNDTSTLVSGAKEADAIVHLAFIHDYSSFEAFIHSVEVDLKVIQAIGDAIAGTNKIFMNANGTLGGSSFKPFKETDLPSLNELPRNKSEHLILSFASRGIRPVSIRFAPIVHGSQDPNFVKILIQAARRDGFSAYVGDGGNIWPSVHVSDAARLVVLGLESLKTQSRSHDTGTATGNQTETETGTGTGTQTQAGNDISQDQNQNQDENENKQKGTVLHGVAENLEFKAIAQKIGDQLNLPTKSLVQPQDVGRHFGLLTGFVGLDVETSTEITKAMTGWEPREIGLLQDLESGDYFK